MAGDASPSRLPYTATGRVDGGTLVLPVRTAAGTALRGGAAGSGLATREAYTASGLCLVPNVGAGDATREAYTGAGNVIVGLLVRPAITATGIALPGGAGAGAATRLPYTAAGTFTPGNVGYGAPSRQALTALGAGYSITSTGSGVLLARQAAGTAISGTLGAGALVRQALTAAGVGADITPATGSIILPLRQAYGTAEAALGTSLNTWVMNTRNNAVTEYPSYGMNSFARYNGVYLGAGAGGLMLLEGGADVDSNVAWTIRTGQFDDNKPGLKRLVELLLSARYDGPVNLRVWTDESTYYDYALPALHAVDQLHQVRVKAGRGLRSRYYMVELSGRGSRLELDSLQATLVPTSRRIG